jgi:hypothetical protein
MRGRMIAGLVAVAAAVTVAAVAGSARAGWNQGWFLYAA